MLLFGLCGSHSATSVVSVSAISEVSVSVLVSNGSRLIDHSVMINEC